MRKQLLILLILPVLFSCKDVKSQMTARVVRDSLFIPWEITYGSDDHIWFTQKNGYICRLEPNNGKIDTLYHETTSAIAGEGGMLGLALHPDFVNQPYVFVSYNYYAASVYKERIVKYLYSSATNTLSNPVVLLDNIGAANYHNGCRMIIANGYLFLATGDATTSSNAQNLSTINGKMLRLNLDGSIPSDNPIAGNPIWSWGHRNAQGLVYANNQLYSSEHGNTTDDEINIIKKGRNFGWPSVEGFCNTTAEVTFCNDSSVVEPLWAWTPTIAPCGIDYYNHPMFPLLQKSLIMCTLKDSKLYQLKLNSNLDAVVSVTVINGVSFGRLRDICLSPTGKIYISTSNSTASGTGTRVDKIIEIYDPSFMAITRNSIKETFLAYPNPASHIVQIEVDKSYSFSIVSIEGQILLSGILQSGKNTIDVKQLTAGIYSLDLIEDKKIYTSKKIVIE